jgi:hypothetical protein
MRPFYHKAGRKQPPVCPNRKARGAFPTGLKPDVPCAEIDGSVQLADHHYFLMLYHGFLGDLDTLVLHQCNQFALFCTQVHSTAGSYWNKQISLIPDASTNTLNILVDGAIVFTYRP